MKFLIIQEKGRHEANREFREALCLKRGIERAGHHAIVWGLNYDNFLISFDDISKDCDALISLENYDTGWHPNISNFKGKKIFWSIDSHCALYNHQQHCRKNKFDLLLLSNIHHAEYFKGLVDSISWFPNGYPSDLIKPDETIIRNVDVGFCGSLIGNRDQWLKMLESKFQVKRDIFKLGNDMVKSLSSYKIAFNLNIADDINFRTFEATGSGALLITNYTPNLEKLFKINEEIVIFESCEDLLEKIRFLLNNDDIRNKISQAGFKKSKEHHSYDVRSLSLIQMTEG